MGIDVSRYPDGIQSAIRRILDGRFEASYEEDCYQDGEEKWEEDELLSDLIGGEELEFEELQLVATLV